jgi:hypothetical protein
MLNFILVHENAPPDLTSSYGFTSGLLNEGGHVIRGTPFVMMPPVSASCAVGGWAWFHSAATLLQFL